MFNSIIVHYGEIGIGNYLNLSANRNSIYFYVLDFGVTFGDGKKFIPPIPPRGSFGGNAPQASMRGNGTEAWQKDGSYLMTPSTFRPIFYSSKANMVLQAQWDVFWVGAIK